MDNVWNMNMYVYHPTNGTSVDLFCEFDENGMPYKYKVVTIWDETGNIELDKSTYDLTWMTFDYLEENGEKC